MIYYLYNEPHRYTLEKFYLTHWAQHLQKTIKLVSYKAIAKMRRVPAGTYIFSDLERLPARDLQGAARLWAQLEEEYPEGLLLNHPLKAQRRFGLLRLLAKKGINDFNVYRASDEPRPERFPVFVRDENDHAGPVSPLLNDQAELSRWLDQALNNARALDDLLVIEHIDTREPDGKYTKYGDFYCAGRVISQHIFRGPNWIVKHDNSRDISPEHAQLEVDYARTMPYSDQIARIFELAGIDYGRIDYTVIDGRVQVFEINTNPHIYTDTRPDGLRGPNRLRFAKDLADSFASLDRPSHRTIKVEPWRNDARDVVRRSAFSALYSGLRLTRGLRYEKPLKHRLARIIGYPS